MLNFSKVGRLFYGLGISAYGIQQLVILDFRPQIIAGFPAWAHTIVVFPLITGVAMAIAGLLVSGMVPIAFHLRRKIAMYLGFYFFSLIIVSHIPYLLFIYPHKLSHLGSWGDVLKTLAFSGSSFVTAASFQGDARGPINYNTIGRIFFCTTIILFGCNHFVYDISAMVPQWFGMRSFWSYFGGAALIASGSAILLKVFLEPVALLLALMLLLWFMLLHVPGAIADPYVDRGNLIVSAFDALLFCGTALMLSQSNNIKQKQ
jgi:hypothetical protein